MVIFSRNSILRFIIILLVIGTTAHPTSAASGFWETEIYNPGGSCKYRVFYEIPDTIETNTTQIVKVGFLVLQMGGTTKSVKTQTIGIEFNAKGTSLKRTIAQEVRELKANEQWGPIVYNFKLLDSDFDLAPKEAVTMTISITVSFKEVDVLWGGEYDHEAKKDDIIAELKSTRVPVPIDYVKMILSLIRDNLPIAIAISVAITVVVYVRITIRKSIRL